MAEANLASDQIEDIGQITLEIVPNKCSLKGGCRFIIVASRSLSPGRYLVKFDNCVTIGASLKYGYHHLHGSESIPPARETCTCTYTEPIDVEVTKNGNSIGSCWLKYENELREMLRDHIVEDLNNQPDGSNANNPSNRLTKKSSNDGRLLEKVVIDMPTLLYLCDEMARRGKEKFFSALKRLDFIGKVLENRREYFEDFATTARKHGHSELAEAIKTWRKKNVPCDPAIEILTLGNVLEGIRAAKSSSNSEPRPCYSIKPENDTVLIISNKKFDGVTVEGVKLVERRGAEANVRKLEGAMRAFGYKNVEIKTDLKAKEIGEVVRKMAKKIDQNSSSFVCFIGTHGDKGKIYGSDSQFIYVNELTDAFKEDNCPHLAGKPKLFFIEASGVGDSTNDDSLNDSQFRSRLDPAEPHFLIAISLAPENTSLKNVEDETWVADELVDTFKKHRKDQDVCSMLVKVNENVSKRHADRGYKQPCQLVFTTAKIVKLSSTAGSDVGEDLESDETEKQNKEVAVQSDRDDEDWSYSMEKQFNVAVVINVEHFDKNDKGFDDRKGSGMDAKKLQRLWKNLGFTVKVADSEYLKTQSIFEFLEQVAEEINEKKNSSCFVCCIMTHGHMGKLYGSDISPVDINKIISLFKEGNCQALAGKPKMFFIPACRKHPDLKEVEPTKCSEALTATPADASENSDIMAQANPHETDFFIGYSTSPGHPSQRHVESGSVYINALVEIFQIYHRDEDVLSMMTRVNNKLMESEHCEQCPAPVLTLTRKVYLPSTA